jgi:holliday junction DNA helicase RuvA
MIYYIEGKLVEKNPSYVVLETGGIAYQLTISLTTYSRISHLDQARLYTEQTYMRDDLPRTFGFHDMAERKLFNQLTSVNGVGGNSAMVMLSSLLPEEIRQAIVSGDLMTLKKIKGIGDKTAQRIIVELKDKLGKEVLAGGEIFVSTHNKVTEEALTALVMLGFAKNTAEKALDKVLKAEGNSVSVEKLVKGALKNLAN